MIHHAMMLIKEQTSFLNKGQIPVMTVDQPLYALAKCLQWTKPDTLGEQHFLVVMGNLHIEMTFMICIGDLLDGSGWTFLLTSSMMVTTGKANAMLSASSNMVLCRHLHQVTACVLHKRKQEAFKEFSVSSERSITMSEWEKEAEKYPMYKFWNLILKVELILLQFVKSIRSSDFNSYKDSLLLICPWMFLLDHHNYARWLPIHIRSMINLESEQPMLYEEFLKGHFTVQKSNRKFSRIGSDHNHEQLNAKIKGAGGAIGLTENDSTLQRWVISGPEISRLIDEFEVTVDNNYDNNLIFEHHDSSQSVQQHFQSDIALNEMGNPFLDNSKDLYSLETKQKKLLILIEFSFSIPLKMSANRLDVVWDRYFPNSLTNATRKSEVRVYEERLPEMDLCP